MSTNQGPYLVDPELWEWISPVLLEDQVGEQAQACLDPSPPKDVRTLAQAIREAPDPRLTAMVLLKLSGVKHATVVQLLTRFRSHSSEMVRWASVEGLARMATPESLEAMLPGLEDQNAQVSQRTSDLLDGLDPGVLEGLLEKLLQSPQASHRERAAQTLARLKPEGFLQGLMQLIGDANAQVSRLALDLLDTHATLDLLPSLRTLAQERAGTPLAEELERIANQVEQRLADPLDAMAFEQSEAAPPEEEAVSDVPPPAPLGESDPFGNLPDLLALKKQEEATKEKPPTSGDPEDPFVAIARMKQEAEERRKRLLEEEEAQEQETPATTSAPPPSSTPPANPPDEDSLPPLKEISDSALDTTQGVVPGSTPSPTSSEELAALAAQVQDLHKASPVPPVDLPNNASEALLGSLPLSVAPPAPSPRPPPPEVNAGDLLAEMANISVLPSAPPLSPEDRPASSPGLGLDIAIAEPISANTPPPRSESKPPIDTPETWLVNLLERMVVRGCSDLHLQEGCPPRLRKDGKLIELKEGKVEHGRLHDALSSLTRGEQFSRYLEEGDLDFAHSRRGLARFRCNYFMQQGLPAASFRVVPNRLPRLADLGVPDAFTNLLMRPTGLLLVTGASGEGKTTTIAALIDVINESRPGHILTVEEPIEFLHADKAGSVTQREVGADTKSFASGLRAGVRMDPDVILVGAVPDGETLRLALDASAAGHLVLMELPSRNVEQALYNLSVLLTPTERQQVLPMLANELLGVLSQTLVPLKAGGRKAIFEVMLNCPEATSHLRTGNQGWVRPLIRKYHKVGMISLEQALMVWIQKGLIDPRQALLHTSEPQELARLMEAGAR
jgi:twitching motility protein PilT